MPLVFSSRAAVSPPACVEMMAALAVPTAPPTALVAFQVAETECLAKVKRALRDGADPNTRQHKPHDFCTALGLATQQGFSSVVSALLDAGAKSSWPGRNVPNEFQLVGAKLETNVMESYEGGPLNPLPIALEKMAWSLCEQSQPGLGTWCDIAHRLMNAGAQPGSMDPALQRSALDFFFLTLVDNRGDVPRKVCQDVFDVLSCNPSVASGINDTWEDLADQYLDNMSAPGFHAWLRMRALGLVLPAAAPSPRAPRF